MRHRLEERAQALERVGLVLGGGREVVVEALVGRAPGFGALLAQLLGEMRAAGGTVIGLDWRIPLDRGWETVGYDRAVQGNLDPTALFAPPSVLREKVVDVLERAAGRPWHIFNLGHGILQHTPVENVRAGVEMVHEYSNQ